LTSASDVLITDEDGVIYQAPAKPGAPSAANLTKAKSFPGAVVFTNYPKPNSLLFWKYFEPTPVYAQTPWTVSIQQ